MKTNSFTALDSVAMTTQLEKQLSVAYRISICLESAYAEPAATANSTQTPARALIGGSALSLVSERSNYTHTHERVKRAALYFDAQCLFSSVFVRSVLPLGLPLQPFVYVCVC